MNSGKKKRALEEGLPAVLHTVGNIITVNLQLIHHLFTFLHHKEYTMLPLNVHSHYIHSCRKRFDVWFETEESYSAVQRSSAGTGPAGHVDALRTI